MIEVESRECRSHAKLSLADGCRDGVWMLPMIHFGSADLDGSALRACCQSWCWSAIVNPAAVDEESHVPLQALSGGLSYTDNANSFLSGKSHKVQHRGELACIAHGDSTDVTFFEPKLIEFEPEI
jgi:hypothetical protein